MLICTVNPTVNPSLQLHLLEHAEAQELEALKRSITDHGLEWLYTGQPGQFIEDSLRRFANRQGFWAGLRLRNELVGVLGINNVNDWTRSAEVDYALGPGFRGKGLMTQAVRAMLDYGFGELHLNRIEIRADKENTKSCTIALRLGFRKEGTLRENIFYGDRLGDQVVHSLLASEWQALSANKDNG